MESDISWSRASIGGLYYSPLILHGGGGLHPFLYATGVKISILRIVKIEHKIEILAPLS